jgi:hypothetical protein
VTKKEKKERKKEKGRCDSIKKKSYNSRHVSKKGRDEGDVKWYGKRNTDTNTNTVEKSVVERMKRDVCWRKGGGGWNVGNVRRAGA